MLIHFKIYKKMCPDRKMQTFPQVLLANDFRMLQTRNSEKKKKKNERKKRNPLWTGKKNPAG